MSDFKDPEIAREIGVQNPHISDKLINAFQLEYNQQSSSLSNKLSSRAIKLMSENFCLSFFLKKADLKAITKSSLPFTIS